MSSKPSSQKVETGPPKWARGYFRDLYSNAGSLYRDSEFFPGQTYAGFSPEQEQAFGLISDRALGGSPVTRAAQDQATATLRGDYLYGGEGFNAAYNAAANRIIPQTNSMFGRAGRSGSGLAAVAQTQALGDSFAGLYDRERQRQLGFAGMAPMLANQDYFDLGQLQNVGAQRQAMEQMGIDEAMARHDFPWMNLSRYAGILNTGLGGTGQVQTSPLYRNRGAGMLGGAATGAYLGSVFPGIGTGIGAIGGGLLGAFL